MLTLIQSSEVFSVFYKLLENTKTINSSLPVLASTLFFFHLPGKLKKHLWYLRFAVCAIGGDFFCPFWTFQRGRFAVRWYLVGEHGATAYSVQRREVECFVSLYCYSPWKIGEVYSREPSSNHFCTSRLWYVETPKVQAADERKQKQKKSTLPFLIVKWLY